MRPIDADALEKTLRDWMRDHWTEAFTGDDAASEFADMIERAETIDTNPTVHAHCTEQPDIEKICARIKAEAIKHNVEYMKHGDRYMLGFVDGMRLARRIVDGTIDDPVYFTLSGEKKDG